MKNNKLYSEIVGKFRLLFGFCPKCNSDAPEIDTCNVCDGYRTGFDGTPTKEIKKKWWIKFKQTIKKI